MATIIENFDSSQLELITSGSTKVSYTFDETKGDYIKLSVFTTDGRYDTHFNSNDDPGFDVYRDANDKIYIKTNEILEQNYVAAGKYNLQFDFLRDSFQNFYYLTEGGCNNPTEGDFDFDISSIADEADCTQLGTCTPNQSDPIEFYTEEECCGGDGTQCVDGDMTNTWLPYEWIDATYSQIEGYEGSKFYVKEISPSRKEVRLIARNIDDDIIDINDEEFRIHFSNKFYGLVGGLGTLNPADENGDYSFDYVLTLKNSINIPITNWTYDDISLDYTTIVLRLNEPVPTNLNLLEHVGIEKEVLPTHQQSIFYISNVKKTTFGGNLIPDMDYYNEEASHEPDNFQNYNQLVVTSSITNTDIDFLEIERNNDYKNLNIDFSNFSNHVMFGSATSKVDNYKNKVISIENHLSEISSSLIFSGSHIDTQRKDLFDKITIIKKSFTPYEKFLYYGEHSSSINMPNIGKNLAHKVPVNMSRATTLNNYEGFNVVYNFKNEESDSFIPHFTDKYKIQDPPFYNYSGSVYLSFLYKVPAYGMHTDTNNTIFNWHNKFIDNPKTPTDTLHTSSILDPEPTGSEWRRYIFEASQSYWRPSGSSMNSNDQGDITNTYGHFDDPNYWEILDTTEKVYSASISGSKGTGYPILLDDTYNQFGTYLTSSGNPFTGSIIPMGELFDLSTFTYTGSMSNPSTATTSSFMTDIKITTKNPSNSLPFSEVYSTASVDWQNWYDNIYASASDYDEKNIHSLKNNLPTRILEDQNNTYGNLFTFVNMWGEQFDLIRNYIDNYKTFYKRNYDSSNSVPDNLLPILGDNLGWEMINPFSSSLSDYYSQVTSSATLTNDVKSNMWRRNLNNLIYIYKSKGTLNSLKGLLNILGYPPDLLNVNELGGSSEEKNPQYITDEITGLKLGLGGIAGNISYNAQPERFGYMNFRGNVTASLPWGHSQLPNIGMGVAKEGHTSIEFMFSPAESDSETQTLVNSQKGSSTTNNWDIKLITGAGANDKKISGSIRFSLNETADISYEMSTSYFPIKDNSNFVNVLLTKDNKNLTGVSQSYSLYVGRKLGDKIDIFDSASMIVTSSQANAYWSASDATERKLHIGTDFTGSMAEFRVWSGSLSASRFKQHILSPSSTTGNEMNDSLNNLIYRFKFNENIKSGSSSTSFKDTNPYGPAGNVEDYSFTQNWNDNINQGQISQRRLITAYKFSLRNDPMSSRNTRMITVNNKKEMIRSLHPKQESMLTPHDSVINTRKNSKQIQLVKSPTKVIDDYIIDNLGDKDISQKYAKWSDLYEPNYQELEDLRNLLNRGVTVDINKFIRKQAESGIFNPFVLKAMKKIMPERVQFEIGVSIQPNILERIKYKWKEMSVEEQNEIVSTLKHPFGTLDKTFDSSLLFSSSKVQNLNEVDMDISSNYPTFSSSYFDMEGLTGKYMVVDSSSFKDSTKLDQNSVDLSYINYINVTGSNMEFYGKDTYVSGSTPFNLNVLYNPNIVDGYISHSNMFSQSALYNPNIYTKDVNYPGRPTSEYTFFSQSANYNKGYHKVNIDYPGRSTSEYTFISQSGDYNKNHYKFTLSWNDDTIVSESGIYNLNRHKVSIDYKDNMVSESAIYNYNIYNKTIDHNTWYSSSGILNPNIFDTGSISQNNMSWSAFYNKNRYNVTMDYQDNIMSQSGISNPGRYKVTIDYQDNITSQSGVYNNNRYKSTIDYNDNMVSQSGISEPNRYKKTIGHDTWYSSSAILNPNIFDTGSISQNNMSWSAFHNPNRKEFDLNMLSQSQMSMSGQWYDMNTYSPTVNLNFNWSWVQGVFKDGTPFPTASDGSARSNLWDMWGRGVNDLHFFIDEQGTMGYGFNDKTTDTYGNTYSFSDKFVFQTIGDIEEISESFGGVGINTYNVDYTDRRHFLRRRVSNISPVDTEYTYMSYYGSASINLEDGAPVAGRPIGRTAYFYVNSDGDIIYPSNHWIKVAHSKEYLQAIYNSSFGNGASYICRDANNASISCSITPSFQIANNKNAQYDVKPHLAYYTVPVKGSNTGKTMFVQKNTSNK